jgi:hypothetical protein
MAVTTELTPLHRRVDELRVIVSAVRDRYGDITALKRSVGDVDRTGLDASELDELTPLPAATTPEASEIQILDDTFFPLLRDRADDEGLGGYHR